METITQPKFKFVYAQVELHHKIEQLHTDWFLLIDSLENFMAFTEIRSKALMSEYWKLKKTGLDDHLSSREQYAMHFTLNNRKDRKSIIDDAHILSDTYLNGYFETFQREGKILVNKVFGFRTCPKRFKILQTVEKDKLIFPEYSTEDIKVSKWPGGKHWYAKIGATDVIDKQGDMKWETYKQAKEEANKFLNKFKTEG